MTTHLHQLMDFEKKYLIQIIKLNLHFMEKKNEYQFISLKINSIKLK